MSRWRVSSERYSVYTIVSAETEEEAVQKAMMEMCWGASCASNDEACDLEAAALLPSMSISQSTTVNGVNES